MVEGTPDPIRLGIGDFCEIEDWHPAVADCDEHDEDGVEYRTLTLADGGTIEERLTKDGDNSMPRRRRVRHPTAAEPAA